MASGRKSSRLCENVFAGIVIFACGFSIILSMKSQTYVKMSKLLQRESSRALEQNRDTFLTASKGGGRHHLSDNAHYVVSKDNRSDDLENESDIGAWFHRKPVDKYMPSKFHPILVRQELISNSVCKGTTVDILIYSLSHWRNADNRAAIRESWAATDTFTDLNIKTVFFLGRPIAAAEQAKIESESKKYGDIVQGDFQDGQANISMKGLLALQWINYNCLQAKYLIKADDDMFVNIFFIIEFGISEIFLQDKIIMCHVRPNNTNVIIRNKKSKWYLPDNILPDRKVFPTTCFANMVLFTADLVPEMYKASFSAPYCTIDDVYIFGMLIEFVKGANFKAIGDTISMDQNEAYHDLVYQHRPQYLASTVKQMEYFKKFWDAALRRIPSWAKGCVNRKITT